MRYGSTYYAKQFTVYKFTIKRKHRVFVLNREQATEALLSYLSLLKLMYECCLMLLFYKENYNYIIIYLCCLFLEFCRSRLLLLLLIKWKNIFYDVQCFANTTIHVLPMYYVHYTYHIQLHQ